MLKPDLLRGKNVLITGGGTGLGKVMTEAALVHGARVHICGRRGNVVEATAKELMDKHGGEVVPHACDIRSAGAVEEMIETIWRLAPLDALVNNAAGNFISPAERLSPRGFDAIAGIVFHGSFYLTLACGKRWIAEKRPASVISILTTWIWNGGPFTTPSAMSKAGINAMTKSLAAEWGKHRIRLNAIAPGPFPTEGAGARLNPNGKDSDTDSHRGIPMGRNGRMPELANLALFLLGDGCEYLTGQTIALDGGAFNASGGNFYPALSGLTEEDWDNVQARIREHNDKDKANRSA